MTGDISKDSISPRLFMLGNIRRSQTVGLRAAKSRLGLCAASLEWYRGAVRTTQGPPSPGASTHARDAYPERAHTGRMEHYLLKYVPRTGMRRNKQQQAMKKMIARDLRAIRLVDPVSAAKST
jgi:hypothetical protein